MSSSKNSRSATSPLTGLSSRHKKEGALGSLFFYAYSMNQPVQVNYRG